VQRQSEKIRRLRLTSLCRNPVAVDQLTNIKAECCCRRARERRMLQMFQLPSMSKIGVEGRDASWAGSDRTHRQVGVANIKPGRATRSRLSGKGFWSRIRCPRSPAQLPQIRKSNRERDYFTDDALNIVMSIIS